MNHQIEQNIKLGTSPTSKIMKKLINAYKPNQIDGKKSGIMSLNKNFDTLMQDLIKLADLKISTPENLKQVKLRSPAYPEMAKFLAAEFDVQTETHEPPRKSSDIEAKKTADIVDLEDSFRQTTVIILPEVNNPADISAMKNFDCLAVSDFDHGLFIFDQNQGHVHRLSFRKNYQHYSKLAISEDTNSKNFCTILVNVQNGSDWGFVVVNIENRYVYEMVNINTFLNFYRNRKFVITNESAFMKFATKENCALTCTNQGIICCTSSSILYTKFNFNESLDPKNHPSIQWREIYGNQKFNRSPPCLIFERNQDVKLVVYNDLWKSIDILEMNEQKRDGLLLENISRVTIPSNLRSQSACQISIVDNAKIFVWAKENASKVFVAENLAESFKEKLDIGPKIMQKMSQGINGKIYCLFGHCDNKNCRQIEMATIV